MISNNRMRGGLDIAQAVLNLFSKDTKLRGQAIASLLMDPEKSKLVLLDKALVVETSPDLKSMLRVARSAALLGSSDKANRLKAARALAQSEDPATQLVLNDRVKLELDAEIKAQLQASLAKIKSSLGLGETLGVVFTGISLGSILLLAALGLAITCGLMGVINVAHGELIMIGAYATYVVQGLFHSYAPNAFDWYLIATILVAFMASALVGAAMECTVIRFLFGRPLETLLATLGIGLILMQSVRAVFGAQNVGVENPSWMGGSFALLPNLLLPYNRLMIVVFATLVLIGVKLVISKTRLGLFARGVTQNHPIAASL